MEENSHAIIFIDRETSKKGVEKVYGQKALTFLYGDTWITKLFGVPLLHAFVKNALFSKIYGFFQKLKSSRKKIQPFIQNFQLNPNEFLLNPNEFSSFNDFFIRKLKPDARPIFPGKNVAIMPADARYFFYPNIKDSTGFLVKGEKFNLETLLQDKELAKEYEDGTMVLARLCPTDYHRYHFPIDCIPKKSKLINGYLYSVNPIALKKDIHIFTQNKRILTELESDVFQKVLFLEIGATSVGTIHETFEAGKFYPKGAEKGYFSFGASSLILLFKKGTLKLDDDLLSLSKDGIEIRCLMGQKLGCVIN